MAYKRVLERDQNHAKVLQQLGWLYHQASGSFSSQEQAIEFLEKSVNAGEYFMMLNQTLLTRHRQQRCAELVPFGSLLHVAAKVSKGLRSLPTGRVP